jgi:hypothetical protein
MDFPFASSGSWLFNRYNTGQPHLVAIISQSVLKGRGWSIGSYFSGTGAFAI